jgi:hypothetical protein
MEPHPYKVFIKKLQQTGTWKMSFLAGLLNIQGNNKHVAPATVNQELSSTEKMALFLRS